MNNSIRLVVLTQLLVVASLPAAVTRYVWQGSPSSGPGYTDWATAAHVIQDAVDAAAPGDQILVTNGVYDTGGRTGYPGSRVYVDKPVALLSVNGPQVTIIRGDKVTSPGPPPHYELQIAGPQCVTLTDGASLTGFTLTNGAAYVGGGVMCFSTNAIVTNCVIIGNSAPGYTADGVGGGAWRGALYNCLVISNSTTYGGGGAAYCTLYNCTVTGNSAMNYNTAVGGVFNCTLYNCILINNRVDYNPYAAYLNYDFTSTLNYCCTTPQPTSGQGNITSGPGFIDYANGNLRLQSNSPCINAGTPPFPLFPRIRTTDMDGRPGVVGLRVDMGAYEFQPGVSGAFIGWLQQYGLPTDGSADSTDADADGMNNWREWVCGTDPTNPLSVLRLLSPSITSTNATVAWQSVAGVNYFLERSANLAAPFTLLATNIIGQEYTTSYADTNAAGAGPLFYRVGVRSP